MPIIQYKCPQGHIKERLERTRLDADNAPRRIHCDQCISMATKVDFPTTGATIFKGSGWTPKGSSK